MALTPDWPHCPTCDCAAPLPSTFISDVTDLPFDVNRVTTFRFKNGKRHTGRVIDYLAWKPDRHAFLETRLSHYRYLIHRGNARNPREAVKMLAEIRRRWEAEETASHAKRLRRSPRTNCRDGYERTLPHKKKMILAEGGACVYCGDPAPRSVDHVVPVSRGGDHRLVNLVPACLPCNLEKSWRLPAEWREARLGRGLTWPPSPRTIAEEATA